MGKFFSAVYDPVMQPLENSRFGRIRKNLIRKAKGKVLDIGSGTGLNFPYYTEAVESVDAIEPDPAMRGQSVERARDAPVPIRLHAARAEDLPFPDQSFDSVTAALVFCTIPYPSLALREIERVCRPGGEVLFWEHVRLDQPVLGKLQDILTPGWKRVADGCHLNRDTLSLIRESRLEIKEVEEYYSGLFLVIRCKKPA
ncbi:class I SAM-dependent methyltransferase [Indiicoccus explosivorum]|uniref:class I SAM-dependent methyltransferase n=1 Tax=Indiicoccus explosivorum TaxID=1917864 RepID=UPI000B444E5D|nr:class I SAM-dependent methyltransferase [Indiicoccus explosivorum]